MKQNSKTKKLAALIAAIIVITLTTPVLADDDVGNIHGYVQDAAGEPLGDVQVNAYSTSGSLEYTVYTDDEGFFRLSLVGSNTLTLNKEGYVSRDGVYYEPFTTLSGVLEKETGEFPFHVPQRLKEVAHQAPESRYADAHLNDVVACFLNTTNVTGGNSGSPTLNARGEQVGIIFDMTYESVIGDYFVIPELQRTISVDIRYVLFILDVFSNAKHLLEEMTITGG